MYDILRVEAEKILGETRLSIGEESNVEAQHHLIERVLYHS